MSYGLGVDLGTTYTAAAVSDASGTRPVPLGRDVVVSSVVFVTEDGELITGDAAEEAAVKQPQRASRAHKRRLADPMPLTIGGAVWTSTVLMAAQLRDVVATAVAVQGSAPRSVVLTCPAVLGPHRREHFSEVPRLAGLSDVRIVTEPEAAAMHCSVERGLSDGQLIGVYDLGGGTFDAAVLRARRHGMEIVGTPGGVERLGGVDFDDALLTYVDSKTGGRVSALDTADTEQNRALQAAREACRQAKEELSSKPESVLHLNLPDGTRDFKVSRNEFNELIKPHVELTIDVLTRTINSAWLRPDDLAGVLLAGGSSLVPLVAQTVSESIAKPVRVGVHSKLAVALGAAAIAREHATLPLMGFSAPPSVPSALRAPRRLAPVVLRRSLHPGAGLARAVELPPGPPSLESSTSAPQSLRPRLRVSRKGVVVAAVTATAVLCVSAVSAAVLTAGSPTDQLADPTPAGGTTAEQDSSSMRKSKPLAPSPHRPPPSKSPAHRAGDPSPKPTPTLSRAASRAGEPSPKPPLSRAASADPGPSPTASGEVRSFDTDGGRVVFDLAKTYATLVSATPGAGWSMQVWKTESWIRVEFSSGAERVSVFCMWHDGPPRVEVGTY